MLPSVDPELPQQFGLHAPIRVLGWGPVSGSGNTNRTGLLVCVDPFMGIPSSLVPPRGSVVQGGGLPPPDPPAPPPPPPLQVGALVHGAMSRRGWTVRLLTELAPDSWAWGFMYQVPPSPGLLTGLGTRHSSPLLPLSPTAK